MIQLKRAYDQVEDSDGCRILIDRLWPRGISKQDLKIEHWLKEVAPSDELRKWFGHQPDKFKEFSDRYKDELKNNDQELNKLLSLCQKHETVTLVYAAKDEKHNNAVVLKEFLKNSN